MLLSPAIIRHCANNSCGHSFWPSQIMPLLVYLTAVAQPQLNSSSADYAPRYWRPAPPLLSRKAADWEAPSTTPCSSQAHWAMASRWCVPLMRPML
jgi:hypothetical protein